MNTKINKIKAEAGILKAGKYIILAVIIILSLNNSKAQTYLNDRIQHVPVFDPSETEYTQRFLFWDLTEINNTNNRLDIGVGVNHIENGGTNYRNGNWYKNENDSNFNSEVTGDRFIFATNSSNTINGFIFSKLDTCRKNAVVTRGNDNLEIYPNSGGSIGGVIQSFHAGGNVLCDGNFSTDTESDVVVLSNNGDTVKIYKGSGNGKLDSTVFYRYTVADPNKVQLAQISNYIYPYSVIHNTISDRDELIYREGQYIKILKNNNNNTFSSWITIDTDFEYPLLGDYKIEDVNNDGYNDIIVSENNNGIKIYVNNAGESFTLGYENLNPPFFNVWSINTGDFNKDGFNDLVTIGDDEISIYLNTKNDELFEEEESSSIYFQNEYKNSVEKSIVADLYNKGGLAVLLSGVPDNLLFSQTREILRVNAIDTDAVPAPAYVFRSVVDQNGIFRPKLLLYNKGDRDFLKYRIYKRSAFTNWTYSLIDSTSNNFYIDTVETLDTTATPNEIEPLSPNLFYYVKTQDNSYQVSVSSDTIKYPSVICPTCPTEPYDPGGDDRGIVSNTDKNNKPGEYSINNFPNPFNPVTQINFSIPFDGNVRITIFNSLGQTVKELINEFKDAGNYTVRFDGSSLPSGIYYYKISSGSFGAVRKMVMIK